MHGTAGVATANQARQLFPLPPCFYAKLQKTASRRCLLYQPNCAHAIRQLRITAPYHVRARQRSACSSSHPERASVGPARCRSVQGQGVRMEGPVGCALRTVSTSCQWATLPSVVTKVNKRLAAGDRVDERSLASLLTSVDEAELSVAGVWAQSFGAQFQPIVLTNPACARARAAQDRASDPVCSCSRTGVAGEDAGRYFGSTDYNAGRHAVQASAHLPNCACWTPPSTSHLHSWRRGFNG